MSPLQTQYPLSPRKFWKKFIGKFFFWSIIWVVLMAVGSLGVLGSSDTNPALDFSLFYEGFMALVSVFILGGILLYAWYLRVYIRRYYYDASENFVTIKKGVFAPAEIHVQYPKIQDVYVDQDILDRVMGLYDVHIASATATSGMEAHIDGVEHDAAEGLKNLLLQRIQGGGSAGAPGSVAQPQVAPGPVTLSEAASSKNYPIQSAWIAQSVIAYLFSSVFVSGFITLYIAIPGKNSTQSITDSLGISPTVVWFWAFVVIFIFHIVYMFIWKSVYYFEFLPEYILMRTGVISRSEVHVPYRAVQDVNVKQGIVERMFGLATVSIENAAAPQMVGKKIVGSGVAIPGQSLEKANHIAEIVRNVTLTKNTAQTGL
jgi:putative membrane protein